MIEIDGKQGEGGGQILRTSVSLSAITGKPVRVFDIRAKRKKPGLRHQHVMSISSAARICGAAVEGLGIESREIVFHPGEISAGDYEFDIGTAGSTTLVLQTILPLLFMGASGSTLVIKGGTHNPSAPPYDFIKLGFLPVIGMMGFDADIELGSYGFYPAGGGEIRVSVTPFTNSKGFNLTEVTPDFNIRGEVVLSNLPLHIAEREAALLAKELRIPAEDVEIEFVKNPAGPGNAVMVLARMSDYSVVFTSFGRRGKPAEDVAKDASRFFKSWKTSGAAFDEHLADQLLIYLAHSGGGRFTTNRITEHFTTNVSVLRNFVDAEVETKLIDGKYHEVVLRI